jgi:hypothetical protein
MQRRDVSGFVGLIWIDTKIFWSFFLKRCKLLVRVPKGRPISNHCLFSSKNTLMSRRRRWANSSLASATELFRPLRKRLFLFVLACRSTTDLVTHYVIPPTRWLRGRRCWVAIIISVCLRFLFCFCFLRAICISRWMHKITCKMLRKYVSFSDAPPTLNCFSIVGV